MSSQSTAPPPPGRLAPGQHLAGRYRIETLLGRGGMGAVYRAHDDESGQTVAVKTILSANADEQTRRFRREFRALTRLSHPHIIAVHDFGQANGTPFYVMEYVRGPDLSQFLTRRQTPLSAAEAVRIGVQVSQALAYIHNQGIIHRDVKPANIMLLEEKSNGRGPLHVKLMDFGLVKVADVSAQLTSSGVWLGTLKYLSPEQVKGLPVDRRADLYALGLVLFEITTDSFPFQADDPFSLAFQRLSQTPISPLELQPNLPPPLGDLILKLLAEDLSQRYASAEELLGDLAPLADESVVVAPAPPTRADIVVQPPLVGRKAEMDRLGRALQAAWTEAGRFVLVEGEAGVGKSRLLRELAGLARQLGGRRLQGGCYEEERLPYSPFVEALRDLIGGRAERFDHLLEGLRPELARLVPTLPLLTEEPAPPLQPEQARLRLFDAVTRFLSRLADERPVLLILDDLQWAEEGTLELLHYLVRNTQDAPIFICGSARHEELDAEHPLNSLLQGLGRRRLAERLTLGRLSLEAIADMVVGMLAGGPPPTQLAERLYREAEGNPLFIEEMLKAWVEEGRLAWEGGRWSLVATETLVGPPSSSMPARVVDLIERRLGRVSDAERDVLMLAAVLGQEFNFDVLLRMAPDLDEDSLLDVVDELLRARLLREVYHPREDRYGFTHNKIQQVAYERIHRRRLRRWHQQAGEALLSFYAGRLDQVVEPLARHFLRADDPRGVAYGLQAGDAARTVYANQQALDYYSRALALAERLQQTRPQPAPAQRAARRKHLVKLRRTLTDRFSEEELRTLCFDLGLDYDDLPGQAKADRARELVHHLDARRRVLELVQVGQRLRPDVSWQDSAEALRLAPAGGELAEQIVALHRGKAEVHYLVGEYEAARGSFRAALAALPACAWATDAACQKEAEARRGLARVYEAQGHYDDALAQLRAALETLQAAEAPGELALIYMTIGWLQMRQGKYQEAIVSCDKGLRLAPAGDDAAVAEIYDTLGVIYKSLGEYERAAGYHQRSLALREELDDQPGIARTCNNLSAVGRFQGNFKQAIAYGQRALSVNEKLEYMAGVADAYNNLGAIYWEQDQYERAIQHYEQALTGHERIGNNLGVAIVLGNLGEVYREKGDLAQAIEYLQLALDKSAEIGDREGLAFAYHLLAEIHLVQRNFDQAIHSGQLALEAANALDSRPYQAGAHKVLGQAYAASGQAVEARAHLKAAQRLFRQLDNQKEVESIGPVLQALALEE